MATDPRLLGTAAAALGMKAPPALDPRGVVPVQRTQPVANATPALADRLGSMPTALPLNSIVPVGRPGSALPPNFSSPVMPSTGDQMKLAMTARLPTPQPREAVTTRQDAVKQVMQAGAANAQNRAASAKAGMANRNEAVQTRQAGQALRRTALQDRLRQMMQLRGQGQGQGTPAGGLLGYKG